MSLGKYPGSTTIIEGGINPREFNVAVSLKYYMEKKKKFINET